MSFQNARFVTSMPQYGHFTGRGLPQVAVVGKSNVGKSSLINSLTNQGKLAKVSQTPGKTRLINVFLIDNRFHLVDLPGYGYAKVSRDMRESWGTMMEGYFSQADRLSLVINLVDIRHEPTKDDLSMLFYLREHGIPFQTVATKADKLSRAGINRQLQTIGRIMAVQPFDIIAYSSETRAGRPELLKKVDEAVADAPV